MVNSYDISWNGTAVAFWGIMETSLALIIASLPALNRPIVKFIGLEHLLSDSSSHRSLSDRFKRKLEVREIIYRGPTKFVRYTADATTHDGSQSYLELGSLAGSSKSDERVQRSSSSSSSRERKYPKIRVEKSYHLTEERASVLELEHGDEEAMMTKDLEVNVARPPKARVSNVERTSISVFPARNDRYRDMLMRRV
ncbi:hypothetical protein ABW21_db0208849 [Orbilia brochopaga]|nr:hypothetical protein ABW21_db0208849 [Drechslerella brochopaga]